MATRTFEDVKRDFLKSNYSTWAENYEQDMQILESSSQRLAANSVSAHFTGDRESAAVLDVACGTGLVAEQLRQHGFTHFVGVDGSKSMLEIARKKGLYEDLKECLLGDQPLPLPKGSFDVVIIVAALMVDHVPVCVVRHLCDACKPGGYVSMVCGHGYNNLEYKADLERELKEMEEEGHWSCVEVLESENWARSASGAGDTYTSGSVYLYKKV
ncbi:methyltransferase-like protein 27 [Parambassis ranga]|uniref:Methyltransferase-like protein 27 n=1 Tax=Parambassis ranga TaxID=210632 RepID=A0A6P7JM95_9TELE|nr:methyltransferase-like protein 27 [Parambassis ranga]